MASADVAACLQRSGPQCRRLVGGSPNFHQVLDARQQTVPPNQALYLPHIDLHRKGTPVRAS